MTEQQHTMIDECKCFGIKPPVPEFQFFSNRGWKFDYAWPDVKVALEVEGGVFGYKDKNGNKRKSGAHSSVSGILRDIEKYNAATSVGWRILRVIPSKLFTETTFLLIKQTLQYK